MEYILRLILVSFIPLVFASDVWAWSGPGHMVVAAIAYRDMPVETKAKVTELLQHHPDYAKWKNSFSASDPSLDLPLFIFMRASTWADEIRRKHNPYDHPTWHYIDYPLKAPNFPLEPAPTDKENILTGIEQCEKVLAAKDSTPELKAVHLAWLIHLIGDLHQPLHCVSLFSAAYPTGDKGGNDFFVKPAQSGVKLHAIWDGLLGTSVNARSQLHDAIQIQTKLSRKALPEMTTATTPKAWSLEGRSVAIEKGYLRGKLQGSKQANTAPALPKDYTKSAKLVAERRAALAGCRLADEINRIVK